MSAPDYAWPDLDGRLRAAEAEVSRRTLRGYFIAPDAFDDLWLWRGKVDDSFPQPVVSLRHLRDDPDVWAVLVAATGGAE